MDSLQTVRPKPNSSVSNWYTVSKGRFRNVSRLSTQKLKKLKRIPGNCVIKRSLLFKRHMNSCSN